MSLFSIIFIAGTLSLYFQIKDIRKNIIVPTLYSTATIVILDLIVQCLLSGLGIMIIGWEILGLFFMAIPIAFVSLLIGLFLRGFKKVVIKDHLPKINEENIKRLNVFAFVILIIAILGFPLYLRLIKNYNKIDLEFLENAPGYYKSPDPLYMKKINFPDSMKNKQLGFVLYYPLYLKHYFSEQNVYKGDQQKLEEVFNQFIHNKVLCPISEEEKPEYYFRFSCRSKDFDIFKVNKSMTGACFLQLPEDANQIKIVRELCNESTNLSKSHNP